MKPPTNGDRPLRAVPAALRGSSRRHDRDDGYALLEVLITLVILMFGLLGLAGAVARSNQVEMESYQRTQAVMILQDMTDRLNANRNAAYCYSDNATGVQLGTGFAGAIACPVGGVATAAQVTQAEADLNAWNRLLQGSAEMSSGSNVGAMIGAVGCIRQIDAVNSIYLISVAWQGIALTFAPTDATGDPCGKDLYGDDRLHRLVAAPVRIAALSAP